MRSPRARRVSVGRVFALLAALLAVSACATSAPPVVAAPVTPAYEDDDFSELIAQMSGDLALAKSRKPAVSTAAAAPLKPEARKERDRQFADRARELFSGIDRAILQMPVVGVQPYDLANSWGASRDGGRRKHRGIDIFAPKGTSVIAVADGIISYIGEQPKGGRCIWLTTETGRSFYYAHLDRWATGIYEGMEVQAGDLLGYVGNTGNAKNTPSHLHFGVNQSDEMVNPYPLLSRASVVSRAHVATDAGAALGTR